MAGKGRLNTAQKGENIEEDEQQGEAEFGHILVENWEIVKWKEGFCFELWTLSLKRDVMGQEDYIGVKMLIKLGLSHGTHG